MLRQSRRQEFTREPDAQLGIERIDLRGLGQQLQRFVALLRLLERLRRFLQQLHRTEPVAQRLRGVRRGDSRFDVGLGQ